MDIAMGESERIRARWVCPSDRHLALRAKLRTGWSVKTGSLESRWGNNSSGGANRCGESFVLSEEERDTIIQVIQRAEALDLTEQERVGRLVERLENMKHNVRVVTSNGSSERRNCGRRCSVDSCVCSCALCGEKFGAVLGASPSLCKDCQKYICQKCGTETSVPFNEIPSSPRIPSILATSLQEKTIVQRIVQRSSNNAQRQFLCRICAESREIWKKSGAWFIKKMPKYVLPEKKERGWSRMTHRTHGQSTLTISGACKSLESAEPQDSSSDEDVARRLASTRNCSASSPSLHGINDNNSSKIATPSYAGPPTSGVSPRISRGRSNESSGCRDESLSNISLDKTMHSNSSQCSRLSPSASVTTLRSRSGGRSPDGHQVDQRCSFEDTAMSNEDVVDDGSFDEGSRKELGSSDRCKGTQVQSIRQNSSMLTVSNDLMGQIQEEARILERNADQDTRRLRSNRENNTSSTWYVHRVDAPYLRTLDCVEAPISETEEEGYGTLEVSLLYDPVAQSLQCKVERARGLRPMDVHGLADPFCKLNLLPMEMDTTIKCARTKTVHKTRDPEFSETVNFHVTRNADMKSGRALHIRILQDDPAGEDFLGEAKFPLHELEPFQTKHYNVLLQDHYPVNSEEEVWGKESGNRGQILTTLSYCMRRRVLLVVIHRVTNLFLRDSNGFSDPFVKLCLVENAIDNHHHRHHHHQQQQARGVVPVGRTITKKLPNKKINAARYTFSTSNWKTMNPEWNEEFTFGIRLTDLTKLTLCLSMWNKGFGKNNYLGGLALGCSSKGARLRHWINIIQFPDYQHRAWHNLTDIVVPAT